MNTDLNTNVATDAGIEQSPMLAACAFSQQVLFVGMHNKPKMKPLDSQTVSGKIIDRIIDGLPKHFDCVKSNLCDVDFLPTEKNEIKTHNRKWHDKHLPTQHCIVVLLGKWVQRNFKNEHSEIVKINHPASCMGNANKEKYIRSAIFEIMKVLR